MTRHTVNRLLTALLVLALVAPAAAQEPRDFTELAASLQPGARVELHLTDGSRIEGTVLGQDAGLLIVNPHTRIQVAPWRIGYSEIRSLDVKPLRDSMRPGTKVLLGIGIGFGVMMILAAIAVATYD
jgi:hypothetical protein